MTPIRFLPDAEAELLHETAYYSTARQGFGRKFKDAVREAANRTARTPQAGAPGLGDRRKFRVQGFPFNVYYRASAEEVLIVAIAPDSKNPGYWLGRMG